MSSFFGGVTLMMDLLFSKMNLKRLLLIVVVTQNQTVRTQQSFSSLVAVRQRCSNITLWCLFDCCWYLAFRHCFGCSGLKLFQSGIFSFQYGCSLGLLRFRKALCRGYRCYSNLVQRENDCKSRRAKKSEDN